MAEPDTPETLTARLGKSARAHDRRRLQTRFAGVEMTAIAQAPERCPVRIGGEVRSQHRSSPEGRRFLRVEIDDGSATAELMFTGRNRIRGIETGRAVVVEGVGRLERGRLVIVNPAYTLLGAATKS
jgi:RecG-like helicase